VAGAVAGGVAGDAVVTALPFMRPPPPGEHDLDAITGAIAADEVEVNARVAAQADLQASDLAVLATADDPLLSDRVMSILPDDDVLERIVGYDDPAAPPWVSTGTTTTSTTAPPGPAPAAVSAGRPPPPDPWAGSGRAGP
jgi:hypothetical protein